MNNYNTTFNSNGTVDYWNVLTQQWERQRDPMHVPAKHLCTLDPVDRDRIISICLFRRGRVTDLMHAVLECEPLEAWTADDGVRWWDMGDGVKVCDPDLDDVNGSPCFEVHSKLEVVSTSSPAELKREVRSHSLNVHGVSPLTVERARREATVAIDAINDVTMFTLVEDGGEVRPLNDAGEGNAIYWVPCFVRVEVK